MLIRTPWKRVILICVWDDIKLAGKKQNIDPMWKVLNKEVDLGEPTSFLDHVPGMCSKTMWKKHRYCWQLENHVWIQNFRRSNWKIAMLGKSAYLFMVLWHGRSCQEMCGTILWVGKQIDSTTLQSINSMHWRPSFSKKKNCNPWENCQKYALKLFWNACTWHVLEGPIFYGQWTNLHDRSQNGPKLVTIDYLVWSLTFIIHVSTNSIAMWETLENMADWDCFKTQILQEILRIQNLHQVEHCAFLEVIRLFQSVGCVRNKLQFRTVKQNQTSLPLTQGWGWTVYPHLIYGIWSLLFFTETRIRVVKNGETRLWTNVKFVQHLTQFKNQRSLMEWLMIWTMLISFPHTSILLVRKLCCLCLKTTKQWSRWS